MALTSTLFTGLSGLDVNQTRLNVVGNNIANVNTVAFKSSRALFKPQFYVTDAAGTPPSSDFGGSNPSQRGLGAVVASIQKDFTPGAMEPTGKSTDLAIDGDGFFIVKGGGQQKFTRDGSFILNADNDLVSTSGDYVQGFGVDAKNNIVSGVLDKIVIPLGTDTKAKETANVTLEGNLNASGNVAGGASILTTQPLQTISGTPIVGNEAAVALSDLYDAADATQTPLFAPGKVLTLAGDKGGRSLPAQSFTVGQPGQSTLADLQGFLQKSMGIDTTVPVPTNPAVPTPGVTTEIDPVSGGAVLVLSGNSGSENALSLAGSAFTDSTGASPLSFNDGINAAGQISNPAGESVHTSFIVYDSLGTPLTMDITTVLQSKSDTGSVWRFYADSPNAADKNLALASGTLSFDTAGKLINQSGNTILLDRTGTGAKSPQVKVNFGTLTSLTSSSTESGLKMTQQDGSSIGTLNSFSIGADGSIIGGFSNGLTRTVGRVAMATFKNPQGLVDQGGNMLTTGPNSGVAIITSPTTLGAGAIRSGTLELSNVDLSKEFINLIISSTGFQAASRVISTSNQLLTELMNSSR